ncbi:MAG: extracellular solute-binding protein [Betaproteobacteria bacterium]
MWKATITAGLAVALVAIAAAFLLRGSGETVVVYVSHDQVFSEPILKDFEKDTGIKVKTVFDTEETKSAGVMNRLIAEKANPQADVYWANEPIRAEVLRQQGVAASYRSANAEGIPAIFRDPGGFWTGFSARVRMLIVNKSEKTRPASLFAYEDTRWAGQAVIAHPLFGTTTAHLAAVFSALGDERARALMKKMKANGVHISSSNGDSADLVASGTYKFAMVDSDDVASRIKQGRPVEGIYPDQQEGGLGCFIVPNAVVLIKGARHAEQGRQLIDYLLSTQTEKKLAFSDAAQIPLHAGVETPAHVAHIETLKVMKVDYAEVAAKMLVIQPFLKDWVGH